MENLAESLSLPDLKEGEEYCNKCEGTGRLNGPYRFCDKCHGEGKLDWIEKLVGKKPPLIQGSMFTSTSVEDAVLEYCANSDSITITTDDPELVMNDSNGNEIMRVRKRIEELEDKVTQLEKKLAEKSILGNIYKKGREFFDHRDIFKFMFFLASK